MKVGGFSDADAMLARNGIRRDKIIPFFTPSKKNSFFGRENVTQRPRWSTRVDDVISEDPYRLSAKKGREQKMQTIELDVY